MNTDTAIPVGTRIKFTKTLTESANEDHPDIIYARKDELGTVVGNGCSEGYWVTWDAWPHKFGASVNEFEILKT